MASNSTSSPALCTTCGGTLVLRTDALFCPRCTIGSLLDDIDMGGTIGIQGEAFDDVVPGVELIATVDTGGMGTVLKGRQLSLGREVAVKVIRQGTVSSSVFAEALRVEAQALARLNHPGIAVLHDFGRTLNGHYFLLMEWVGGSTLRQLLARRGTLSLAEAAQITLAICDALHHAHERCTVHRDVKPDNIMLSTEGLPKLIDFGLARLLGKASARWGTAPDLAQAQHAGTTAYMSPEQATDAAVVNRRADLYALALTLREMVVGKEADKVPAELQDFLARALHTDPNQRFATAEVFAVELRAELGLADLADSALPRPRRKPWKLWTALAAGWLLAIAAVACLVPLWLATQAVVRTRQVPAFPPEKNPLATRDVTQLLAQTQATSSQSQLRPCDPNPGFGNTSPMILMPGPRTQDLEAARRPIGASETEADARQHIAQFATAYLYSFTNGATPGPAAYLAPIVDFAPDPAEGLNFEHAVRDELQGKLAAFLDQYPSRHMMVLGQPLVTRLSEREYGVQALVWMRFGTGLRMTKREMMFDLRVAAPTGQAPAITAMRSTGRFVLPFNLAEVKLGLGWIAEAIATDGPKSKLRIPYLLWETQHFAQDAIRSRDQVRQRTHDSEPPYRCRLLGQSEPVKHDDYLYTSLFDIEALDPIPEADIAAGQRCVMLLSVDFEEPYPKVRAIAFRR